MKEKVNKMDVFYSSKDLCWETPKELFDVLNNEFVFTLDPCCLKETAKCKKYFTTTDDGLAQDWSKDKVFINPPYGREIGKWVKKAHDESKKGALCVMLIPSRTDTRWFHDYILNNAEIRFMKGRTYFIQNGIKGGSAPFPTMIVIFKP